MYIKSQGIVQVLGSGICCDTAPGRWQSRLRGRVAWCLETRSAQAKGTRLLTAGPAVGTVPSNLGWRFHPCPVQPSPGFLAPAPTAVPAGSSSSHLSSRYHLIASLLCTRGVTGAWSLTSTSGSQLSCVTGGAGWGRG